MEDKNIDNKGWLKKLAEESWQAELIISGVAIYGSLQLPALVNDFSDWAVTYFATDMRLVLWIIVFYLSLASSGLIIGFILHFILRAIWVGFTGLNSVYPNGINENTPLFSKTFIGNLKRDFSIGDDGLRDLDRFCSVIFAINTIILLVTLTLVINVSVLYGIKYLLDLFLPNYVFYVFFIVINLLLLISVIIPLILNHDRFKGNASIQENGYKIFKLASFVFHHVFRKPNLYLPYLFQSYSRRIESGVYGGVIMIAMVIVSFFNLKESSIGYFINPNKMLEQYAIEEEILPQVYETNLTEQSNSIYSAMIPSEVVSDNMMKLFIPIFPNEEPIYTNLCGAFEEQTSLTRAENRKNRRLFNFACFNRYHRITVNDSIVSSELLLHQHPHKKSDGVLTYLPTDNFKKGKNLLKVEKLTNDSTGVYRTMMIPFWFEGE